MTDLNFTAAAVFDRKLFWEGGDSVRYLVARLKAHRKDDRRPAERAPLNIALVIDASGSMGGGKLEAAKEAALGLAERLTERDRLTVVSFASDVLVHLDGVAVTTDNAARIRSEISRLQTRGMTLLSGGWFAGVECAARIAEEDPRMTPRVIILSDGHANEGIVDPEELREHAGELRMRGVLTSCLGIGDGYDEQLLRGIAESGGGRLHDAELTSEISSVLLGELDDIFGTVVDDAQIALTVPASVRVEVLGRTGSESRDGRLLVPLGPVQDDIERVAVFKITCPKARQNDELAFELTASGRAVDDRARLEADTVRVRLAAVGGDTNKAQSRDIEIAAIVARTWSAHVVTTAARMNRDGAYEEAERYIERELRHFRRYVESLDQGPEMIRELELLAGRVGRQFSSRMRKEMVVQASLAMESRVDRRGMGKAAWSARMERGD
ncbi:vWA domain-containing protein [Sedimentimonas flavescens]|uniref:vWA domain-containing protein n=1 Tax=Sedimentimonas flavescens TaxID=2851012 RepID=UPI001C4A6A93|nr:VWA domain-containing protein [Sedimentimonas flavescens]MBW0158407.1 VWA domain-containing protein [Sedimentimonas flavescens]